jgi:hypothetical protein
MAIARTLECLTQDDHDAPALRQTIGALVAGASRDGDLRLDRPLQEMP